MFGLLLVGLLAGGFFVGEALHRGASPPAPALVAALACLVGVAVVLVRIFIHAGGVTDWVQGGVVDAWGDGERVTWSDWAIAITRRGSVDARTGVLRLERRLAFGLIPLATVVRPLGEFYRVEVVVTPRTRRRRNGRVGLLDLALDEEVVTGHHHAVYVVDRRADKLCVLDIEAGTWLGDRAERFVGRFREQLAEVVGRPGDARRPPPEGDFDAWRARRERGG
jgi:hypothetical protein